MSVYEAPEFDNHEQVLFVNEPKAGLRAIIAIHNTSSGPALGGCRMWAYESEADAIRDVLRLSRGMTYKAAMMNVKLGGGKSVIIGDSRTQKTPQLFHAMGRWINSLNGNYITGEDIGTGPLDMREIKKSTDNVSCLLEEDGGYGDPAPMTALGVLKAIRAGMEYKLGTTDFKGIRVAIQGVGNVGHNLCRLLHEAGATIFIADVNKDNLSRALEQFPADVVAIDKIYDVDADIFSPCAMGAILNDDTIPRLNAKVVAGAANNQLDAERHGQMLLQYDITYLPDYVANGGGLISCAAEWYREGSDQIREKVQGIYHTCNEILKLAGEKNIPTSAASNLIAEKRFTQSAD